MADQQTISFKNTLNLPRTDLPIRAQHVALEEQLLKRWAEQDIYAKTFAANQGNTKFIVHDGPPYANGPIHLGHAYNKILKDMVAKNQRMAGKHVPVTPGFDCHGLPIEHKVTQEHPGLGREALIAQCRAYATHWIDVQREQFKQLGVFMDWDHPYKTMDYTYEAAILQALGAFVAGSFIERKNKTIPWCSSCQTALAAAEIEYKDRKDPSIYVAFALEKAAQKKIFSTLDRPVSLVIWTTTPWTLPLNRAVVIKPETVYAVMRLPKGYGIVAQALAARVAQELGVELDVVSTVRAEELSGARVQHPIDEALTIPVILDNSVSLQDGTACVHCAPGCGPEDYDTALKYNLEVYSPLTADGRYDQGIVPAELVGMTIADGQGWVITRLMEAGSLLHKGSIKHSYPHCWRCRNGLMFRATKQWFLSLSQEDLRERALEALEHIHFSPEQSKNSLRAAIESRLEWCISRQRVWGVPITALLCTKCDAVYLTPELVNAVAKGVAKEGVEYWYRCSLPEVLSHNAKCAQCGSADFKKETDILDVWFDAGVSHYAVLMRNPALAFPADAYIEGRDQARGWFQSSLLTSMVLEQAPCMRSILTHGYTVDEKGQKMSKSLGNVVAPQDIAKEFGTDVLRLWVASIDYADDAVVSRTLLNNVQEVYRKIRNTARFLLSNMYDFTPSRDALAVEQLLAIDQYALRQLFIFNARVRDAYDRSDFTAVAHLFADYCSTELSALYVDIIKDRLYVECAHGRSRRSAQTVCWHMLDVLTRLMAPILSFTAEQLADYYQGAEHESIHVQPFAAVPDFAQNLSHNAKLRAPVEAWPYALAVERLAWDAQWVTVFAMRDVILKAIEVQRAAGLIKHPLEARLTVSIDSPLRAQIQPLFDHIAAAGQTLEDFLKELCIVSQVIVTDEPLPGSSLEHFGVAVERAQGVKCPRCWQYVTNPGEHDLCLRCLHIVKSEGNCNA